MFDYQRVHAANNNYQERPKTVLMNIKGRVPSENTEGIWLILMQCGCVDVTVLSFLGGGKASQGSKNHRIKQDFMSANGRYSKNQTKWKLWKWESANRQIKIMHPTPCVYTMSRMNSAQTALYNFPQPVGRFMMVRSSQKFHPWWPPPGYSQASDEDSAWQD